MLIQGVKFFRVIAVFIVLNSVFQSLSSAVEVASRISDREIIEGLADIRGDIKEVKANIDGRFKEIKADINRLDQGQKNLEKQFDKRFESVDKRFDMFQWMFGVFITAAMVMIGFVLRMQWQMQKRQTMVETTLETQKDELAFIKRLVEKFLPPKGAL